MSNPTPSRHLPQAYAAIEALPALYAEVAASLRRQAARAVAYLERAVEPARLLATIEQAIADPRGGLITVEGLPGSGVSSLLAALAARGPRPLWLADDDPAGLTALYAQLIALRRPHIPLIDPADLTDPTSLDRLLAEVAGQTGPPLTILIDLPSPSAPPRAPAPPFVPGHIPPGVTVVVGCAPSSSFAATPRARLRLPDDDPDRPAIMAQALAGAGVDRPTAARLAAAAQGSLLYLDLAVAWLADGALDAADLPNGLNGLLSHWWERLDEAGQRLALLLAAAGDPLPLAVAAELSGADPEPTLQLWESRRLIDLAMQLAPAAEDGAPARPAMLATFAHSAPRAFLASRQAAGLEQAHAALSTLASSRLAAGGPGGIATPEAHYLARELARHAALGPAAERAAHLAAVTSREWVRAHARRASLAAAAGDAAWEMRAATEGPPLRAVRAAALAGTLATRARTLDADSAVAALEAGFEHGSREAALKRVVEIAEHLPDGLDKAQLLRRLGEACYNARMRTSAMRLLSRALDLEANPTAHSWREQREQLFAALASAAIAQHEVGVALKIAERIEHLERRAAVETQVTRHLIAVGDLDRARRVAWEILHESMGAWARAEVAVALVRAGDSRGAMLLEELTLETVIAWAQIELACDLAVSDSLDAARARLDVLPSTGQRDRGLARLAHALALAAKDGEALAAAEQISAVEVRVAALLDLRLTLEGLVAMLALERATSDIGAITGDDRAPLLASLAAAHAAIGRRDAALQITAQLPEGEERDRAMAKVAVAIAQSGDIIAALSVLDRLDDEDERDWAKDEIARILAGEERWEEGLDLARSISAADQRARTAADLAIARARSGQPLAAMEQTALIDIPADRARALTLIVPPLIAAGHADIALSDAHIGLLARAEARDRYLAAVAAALADIGHYQEANAVIARISRPSDRARAGIALARALAVDGSPAAAAVLGAALRAATVGREDALRALEWSATTLAALGGAELLSGAAAVVDEIDRWL